MRMIYCVLLLLCLYGSVFGQEKSRVAVGMTVADIKFNQVLNYNRAACNLRDFSKKIILINFWTTTCGACLKKVPLLDSMQKAHADELAVLLVSSSKGDTKERVYRAFGRIKESTGKAIGLPVILGDTILKQRFPHQYVPHFVLLDSHLKLLAVSDNEELTAISLAAIIKTGKAEFTAQNSVQGFSSKRLLFTDEASLPGIVMQSTISRYLPNTPSSSYITRDGKGLVTRILLTNQSIKQLLKRACHYFDYPDIIGWADGLEPRLNPTEKPVEWVRANSYTYQLVCEPIPYDSALRIMQRDIEQVFGYAGVVRDTVAVRYVLKARDPLKKWPADGAECADVLQLIRYLSRQLQLDIHTKLPNNVCTNINLQEVTGKPFAELETLLAEQGFYFTKEPVSKRSLFIYQKN